MCSSDLVYMGFLGSKLKAMRNEDLKWKEKFDYNVGLDFNIGRLFSMKFEIGRASCRERV